MISQELITYLMTIAVRLSGFPAIPTEEYPLVKMLTQNEIIQFQCPEEPSACQNMVAFYEPEKNTIFLRDSLNLKITVDNSFLLHEMVHVLQHKSMGQDVFKDCANTLQSERQAYRVQNTYLVGSGLSDRFGDGLNYMVCSDDQNSSRDHIKIEPILKR